MKRNTLREAQRLLKQLQVLQKQKDKIKRQIRVALKTAPPEIRWFFWDQLLRAPSPLGKKNSNLTRKKNAKR